VSSLNLKEEHSEIFLMLDHTSFVNTDAPQPGSSSSCAKWRKTCDRKKKGVTIEILKQINKKTDGDSK
jgi:hypothetical protein